MVIYKIIEMVNDAEFFVSSQDPLTEKEKSDFLSTLARVKNTYKNENWTTKDFIDASIERYNALVSSRSHILHFETNPISDTFMF